MKHSLMFFKTAHGMPPFYGQGMNSAFEDALVFSEVFDQENGADSAVSKFADLRCDAGHAITQLSIENWYEMQAAVASPLFLLQKKVESVLQRLMPNIWIPKYTMVAFTRIPYHTVIKRDSRQQLILRSVGGIAVGATLFALLRRHPDFSRWLRMQRRADRALFELLQNSFVDSFKWMGRLVGNVAQPAVNLLTSRK